MVASDAPRKGIEGDALASARCHFMRTLHKDCRELPCPDLSDLDSHSFGFLSAASRSKERLTQFPFDCNQLSQIILPHRLAHFMLPARFMPSHTWHTFCSHQVPCQVRGNDSFPIWGPQFRKLWLPIGWHTSCYGRSKSRAKSVGIVHATLAAQAMPSVR